MGEGGKDGSHAGERAAAGVLANTASMAAASLGDALAKLVVTALPAPQTLALRCVFLLLLLTPLFIATWRRGGAVLTTTRPWLHMTRFLLQFVSVLAAFTALRHLPLTTVTAIMFVAPIFVAIAAVPILGERIQPRQIGAIALGFSGCLIILRPRGDGDLTFTLVALFSAATWAISIVILRLLTRTDGAATILAWGNGLLLVAAAALALFDWRPMDARLIWLLIGMAALQVVGQWFSMTALRIAPAGTVAPAQYTQILWATIIGVLIFSDWPQPTIWIGAALIIAGGFWLMRSERTG